MEPRNLVPHCQQLLQHRHVGCRFTVTRQVRLQVQATRWRPSCTRHLIFLWRLLPVMVVAGWRGEGYLTWRLNSGSGAKCSTVLSTWSESKHSCWVAEPGGCRTSALKVSGSCSVALPLMGIQLDAVGLCKFAPVQQTYDSFSKLVTDTNSYCPDPQRRAARSEEQIAGACVKHYSWGFFSPKAIPSLRERSVSSARWH